jgi:HAD superfamily phosphoserine phosphatase-like hydrolase
MKTHTLEALLQAMDALAELRQPTWVATDADGTLWATDVADKAWERLLRDKRLLPTAEPVMARALRKAKLSPTNDVHADAARVYAAYRAGIIDDWAMLDAMTACYAGWTEAEVREFGRELALVDIAPRTYSTTVDLLKAIVARGHKVAVVSGSPQLLVDEAVRTLGVPALVVGVELERDGAHFSDRLKQPIPWEKGKVQALAAHGVRAPVAFGDTMGDLALLEAAQLRVLVHPRPGLRARAVDHDGWCLFAPCRTVGGHEVTPPSIDRAIV